MSIGTIIRLALRILITNLDAKTFLLYFSSINRTFIRKSTQFYPFKIPYILSFTIIKRQIFFWAPDFSARRKKQALKTKAHVLVTTRNTAFCSLLSKYHLQLSFLMCFHQVTQWGFCSPNVVLTSKMRCASKDHFHNSNASV